MKRQLVTYTVQPIRKTDNKKHNLNYNNRYLKINLDLKDRQ